MIDMRIEHKKNTTQISKIAFDQDAADLRGAVSFEYKGVVGEDGNEKDPTQTHLITANLNGSQIGALMFTAYIGSQKLTLDGLMVDMKYRDVGFEMMLLAEFNKIYMDQFQGWPLAKHFTDPFAELKFRQALDLNWLSRDMLNEEHITRDYSDSDQQFWDNTLKNMIQDERVRGASINRRRFKKKANVNSLDIQERQISNRSRKIEISRDGEVLGFIQWEVYPEHNIIYINYMEIYEQYRQNGLAMLLYKEFSKVYNEKYPDWKISRKFVNPVAEYVFSKAVADGLFPESTLDNIRRDYDEKDVELWNNELEPKLVDYRKNK